MRTKCPICRARIPPSKEMVETLRACRAKKQRLEDNNDTSSDQYRFACNTEAKLELRVGADWDGVTVLKDNRKPPAVMPAHIMKAIVDGDTKIVLRWINADRSEDRANANAEGTMGMSALIMASLGGRLELMSILLQLGADINYRSITGGTVLSVIIFRSDRAEVMSEGVELLLSWGASFFPGEYSSRGTCISQAKKCGNHELADLLESELGGRRCEIVNHSSRPELNGKTCVADEYLPDSNQYKVTLETKSKEVLVLGPDNLKRRDRTPQDCGYYVEFKNGRTIRHDFASSEDCRAFVANLKRDQTQPAVTEEAEAAAERAAAELLAELGLEDVPNESPNDRKSKKPKKKKGGNKKKK